MNDHAAGRTCAPAGTFGSRCAASNMNSLYISISHLQPRPFTNSGSRQKSFSGRVVPVRCRRFFSVAVIIRPRPEPIFCIRTGCRGHRPALAHRISRIWTTGSARDTIRFIERTHNTKMEQSAQIKTISIIGGTGALGSGLARRWVRAGYRVVIGSRKTEKAVEAAGALINALSDASPLKGCRIARQPRPATLS